GSARGPPPPTPAEPPSEATATSSSTRRRRTADGWGGEGEVPPGHLTSRTPPPGNGGAPAGCPAGAPRGAGPAPGGAGRAGQTTAPSLCSRAARRSLRCLAFFSLT